MSLAVVLILLGLGLETNPLFRLERFTDLHNAIATMS